MGKEQRFFLLGATKKEFSNGKLNILACGELAAKPALVNTFKQTSKINPKAIFFLVKIIKEE